MKIEIAKNEVSKTITKMVVDIYNKNEGMAVNEIKEWLEMFNFEIIGDGNSYNDIDEVPKTFRYIEFLNQKDDAYIIVWWHVGYDVRAGYTAPVCYNESYESLKTKLLEVQKMKIQKIIKEGLEAFAPTFKYEIDYNLNEVIEYALNYDFDAVREMMDEAIYNIIDSETPIYNHDLIEWMANNYNNASYVEDAIEEGLVDMENFNLFTAIQIGWQWKRTEELNSEIDDFIEYLEQEL